MGYFLPTSTGEWKPDFWSIKLGPIIAEISAAVIFASQETSMKDAKFWQNSRTTVDGTNPAPVDMVDYLIVYRVSGLMTIPGGWEGDFWTITKPRWPT